jgi:integrase
MPPVNRSAQNTPSFSTEAISGLAKWKHRQQEPLFARCSATGMRIGEALGLEIDKHMSSEFLTIGISQKARHCKVETCLKTSNAMREVDVRSSIAALLREFVGDRKTAFVFQPRKGKPLLHRTL